MNFEELIKFIQSHFSDGLVLVIGSGLSVAEGIPGMSGLSAHLSETSRGLSVELRAEWTKVQHEIDSGSGLEAALISTPPSEEMERWIIEQTSALLLPIEREVLSKIINGEKVLRLTNLLDNILKPIAGIPILTTNYDRLVEVACEMAGLHVDTTAIGQYAGLFDHERSCMASCKGVQSRGKVTRLNHFPRAVVLKPHGSLDWYRIGNEPRRCSLDLNSERLIITPGLNKYRAGYNAPFDKHRDLANDHIKKAARFLIVGYGFNDDHLQVHLRRRITDGVPTLILNLEIGRPVLDLVNSSPNCIALSKPDSVIGTVIHTNGSSITREGDEIWDLGVLVEKILK